MVLHRGPASHAVAIFSQCPRTLRSASRRQFLTPSAIGSGDEFTSVGFSSAFHEDALWNDVLEVPTLRDQLSPR